MLSNRACRKTTDLSRLVLSKVALVFLGTITINGSDKIRWKGEMPWKRGGDE